MPQPNVQQLLKQAQKMQQQLMTAQQELAVEGWGFSFNDPEGNSWEVGAPRSTSAAMLLLGGRRPATGGPFIAVRIPRGPGYRADRSQRKLLP